MEQQLQQQWSVREGKEVSLTKYARELRRQHKDKEKLEKFNEDTDVENIQKK